MLKQQIIELQQRIEIQLDHYLPLPTVSPERLHSAMRYSSLDAGKRVRPLLVYLSGLCFGADLNDLDGPACAVELIHSYSLIHDDLPAMDDDDLRRGKATSHRAFDEATAILAGDALHTLGFEVLSTHPLSEQAESQRVQMIASLAKASGSLGMGGGQAIDLAATGQQLSLDQLMHMHQMKTGQLICCSIKLGALTANAVSKNDLLALGDYGNALGLAFQIRDDILDIEADTATLGKPQGSDLERGKATFPALVGIEQAKQMAEQWVEKSLLALTSINVNTSPLAEFAQYLMVRNH